MIDDEKRYTVEEVVELCKTAPIVVIRRQKTDDFLYKAACENFY